MLSGYHESREETSEWLLENKEFTCISYLKLKKARVFLKSRKYICSNRGAKE